VLADYQLGHRIGAGGSSEVFAATRGDEALAVKLVREGALDHDAVITEAARMRLLDHPAIVRVIEAGRDPDSGRAYLVMERLEGGTLADRLPLAEAEVRAIGAAIADGMTAAHARGVIHRDLKPGNIMFRGDTPVILDFGIARSLGATGAVVTQDRVGTLAYMAPEQIAGGVVAPSVDIWALGVILFEAATGKLPFGGFVDGRMPQLVDTAPRAGVSPGFDAVVARCLAREPGRRWGSMRELAGALRAAAGERHTEDLAAAGIAPPVAPDAAPPPRTSPFTWAVGAIVAVGLGVGTALLVAGGGTGPIPAPEPVPEPGPVHAIVIPDAAVDAPPDAPIDAPVDAPVDAEEPDAELPVDAAPPAKKSKRKPKAKPKPPGETLD
jgi:serine/threonine protein kinase